MCGDVRAIILICAALAVLVLAGHAHASDASQTLSSCELLLRGIRSKGDQVSVPAGGMPCWHFMDAVQGLIVIAPNETDGPYLRVCAPENSKLTQLVRSTILRYQFEQNVVGRNW